MEIKREFSKKILECKWLENCGREDFLGFEVEYTNSLNKVNESINGIKWENICLEEEGDFTAFLHLNYKEDYKYWNKMVVKIKKKYLSVISESLETLLRDNKNKDGIIMVIKANLVTLFMLNFYSDYKSDFYDKMLKIYLSGHLPCGWKGKYPKGKFIVY